MSDLTVKLTAVAAGAGAALAVIAALRLVRGGKLRRNHATPEQEEAQDRLDYDWLLSERCPEHGPCVRATRARDDVERECSRIQKDAKDRLREAERLVGVGEYHVRAAQSVVDQFQKELAEVQVQAAKEREYFGNVGPTTERKLRDVQRRVEDYTQGLVDDERRLWLYQAELREAKYQADISGEKHVDCMLRLQDYVREEHDLCEIARECTYRYPSWQTYREKRQQRRRRARTPVEQAIPLKPQHVRFGVEIEGVIPYDIARDPHAFVAQVVARELDGRKDDRQNVVFDADDRAWHVEHDGSVASGGFELVTPVLRPRDIPTVQRVAKALRDAGALSGPKYEAGLHVHVSHPSMRERMAYVAQAAVQLDRSVERAKTRYGYAAPLHPKFVDAVDPTMDEEDLLRAWYGAHDEEVPDPELSVGKGSTTRYQGVNFHALPYMGTVEVRAFDGTLEPEKIKDAIMQSIRMITARKNGRRRLANKGNVR